MKPETRTVTELFERDVRYSVPLYQRPYVWTEEKQWEPFWEDILVLLNHQLSESWNAEGFFTHFLGAIVLEQVTQAPGEIPLYTVIDGQQRLTTLQIVLAAARRSAFEHEAKNDAGILHDLVMNDERKTSGDELFKVWPTNANRAAFKAVMHPDGPQTERKDDPENLIDEAYDYFSARLAEWVDEEQDADQKSARLNTLRVTLGDLLKVVSITLEPGDNAQVIFETLNARGTPLLALDLVKNAVFLEADRQDLPVDALYEEVWKPELDSDYWREDRRQGRLFRAQGELFLMHWLGMKLRRVIPATELFTTFRTEILQREPKPEMEALIRELCRDAAILRSFDTQPPGSLEATFFERLENLDITTVMPLILLLFREPAITPERRRRALRMLESWLVRRSLMRLTTKNYNQEVAALLGRITEDAETADDVILEHLRSSASDVNRWPTDEALIKSLSERDAYGSIKSTRLVMVLSAVEKLLYTSKVEALPVPEGLSLEHLMPQEWDKNWPIPPILDPSQLEEAREGRERRIHRLGNLTLVTIPLNSAMSNSDWQTKKRELNKGSKLLLNTEILEAYPHAFTDGDIDARTSVLAGRICTIWQGPEHAWV